MSGVWLLPTVLVDVLLTFIGGMILLKTQAPVTHCLCLHDAWNSPIRALQ
jgi:hypothetical protein